MVVHTPNAYNGKTPIFQGVSAFLRYFIFSNSFLIFAVFFCKNSSDFFDAHVFLFIFGNIFKQDPRVISSGIENAIDVNVSAAHAIKANIFSADKKTIITLYVCNG